MIYTTHSEQLHRTCTVFLLCVLVATLPSSSVQAQPTSPPVADPVAQAEMQALWSKAKELQRGGKLEEAIGAMQKLLVMERRQLGGSHRDLISLLNFLAELQEAAEDDVAVETSRKELLSLNNQVFGQADWRTADAQRALEDLSFRRQLTPERRRELQSAYQMNRAAVSLLGEGKHDEAIVACRKALAVHTSILGEKHPDTANCLANLGVILHAQGDHAGRPGRHPVRDDRR